MLMNAIRDDGSPAMSAMAEVEHPTKHGFRPAARSSDHCALTGTSA